MKQRWDQNITKFHRVVIGLYITMKEALGDSKRVCFESLHPMIKPVFSIFAVMSAFVPLIYVANLNEERWNYPLRSKLLWLCGESQSETGRDKQRPGGAASCQTAPRMIEDNPALERKHPYRPSPCTQPLLLHRRPWWTTGNQQLGQDGAGNSFMTEQNCWKSHSYSVFKGSRV